MAEIHSADRAVGVIGGRLAIAAHDLCKARVGSVGIVLDDAARYSPAWRSDAAKLLGSTSAPVVIALVPGGVAQQAGVRVGDSVAGVDGWAMPAASDSDRVELVQDRIEQVAPPRPLVLHLSRAGAPLNVRMIPELACRTRFQVVPGGTVQAQANGTRVEISTSLVSLTDGDDELAVLLAHELAHNILEHRQRLAAAGAFGPGLTPRQAARLIYATEVEADRLAVYLVDRAGFGLGGFNSVWGRLDRGGGTDHPPNAQRAKLVAKQISRVRAARRARQLPQPIGLEAYLRSRD
jgi:hypothetical protein